MSFFRECLFVVAVVAAIAVITGCTRGPDDKHDKQSAPSEIQPLPIEKLLGQSRDDVRRKLGTPERTGNDFDSFFKLGVGVEYDDNGTVKEVVASHYVSGDHFGGKVLGISLGDSKQSCIAAWGKPVQTKSTSTDFDKVTWHHLEYILELELWASDGSNKEFGTFRKDTVKHISISKKAE
jgi:hypothetical protein